RHGKSKKGSHYAEIEFVDRALAPLLDDLRARSANTVVVLTSDHGTVFHPRPKTRRARYGYDVYTATLHVPLAISGPSISPRRLNSVVTTMDILPTLANILRDNKRREFYGSSLVPEIFYGER